MNYPGMYRGVVTEINDPSKLNRLGVSVPSIMGSSSVWAFPCMDVPAAGVPSNVRVGDGVWVSFEGGDPAFPIWMGFYGEAGTLPRLAVADPVADSDAATKRYVDTNRRTITAPALSANWAGTITIWKVGKVVTISFHIWKTTAPAAWEVIATLPAGCRPREFVVAACMFPSSGAGPYWVCASGAGAIQVVGWTTWPTNQAVNGTLTYIEAS